MPTMATRSGFADLVPEQVRAALLFGEVTPRRLWPREEAAVADATSARRAEYRTTRECARAALQDLGIPPTDIPTGEHREPIWPQGVVGSLTHCVGARAAAVARAPDVRALGIDIEPSRMLPPGVLDVIATEDETSMLQELHHVDPTVPWESVLFSAKESVFKAWFPLTGNWIGYTSCSVSIDSAAGAFSTRFDGLTLGGHDALCDRDLVGKWRHREGFVFTAVHVPRG